MKTSARFGFRQNSQRGSALLAAMLFTFAIAVMVASYHSLIHFNLRTSHRNYHGSAAINLAETGLEEGMWAINKKRAATAPGGAAFDYAAAGWTVSGNTAVKEFLNTFSVGTANETYVKVKITNCNLVDRATAGLPTIKAYARVTLGNNLPAVDKWLEVTLDAPSTGIPSEQGATHPGLVAKESITFSGNNGTVDSWNSDPHKTGDMTHRYDSTTKDDQGFVGSLAVNVDTVNVSNADILGYVATVNDANLANNVGPNGSILADDSPSGTKIDPRRVKTDFKANLPDIAAPTTTPVVLGTVDSNTTLPRSGDARAADGKYYYQVSGINLNSSDKLVISSPNVVVTVPSPYNIKVTGQASIQIQTDASLDLYAGRDVDIAGNGVANGTPATPTSALSATDVQAPSDFKLYGTGTTGSTAQSIKIAGNGALSGVIYAPNANVTINGNGDVMGSVVAKNIVLTGNAAFHYDQALGQLAFGTTADTRETALKTYRWRELLDPSEKTF